VSSTSCPVGRKNIQKNAVTEKTAAASPSIKSNWPRNWIRQSGEQRVIGSFNNGADAKRSRPTKGETTDNNFQQEDEQQCYRDAIS
jgi:hypothetical protein